ncbi:MAG: histidine kinase, partial [Flavobacteriales bacterium]|nr:histidine kinase [Flavobacteriales bacterium]
LGAGAFRIGEDGSIQRLATPDGLINDHVLSIAASGSTVLFATLGGAASLDLDDPSSGIRDLKLPGNGFLYDVLALPDGTIYFASDGDGIIRRSPNGEVDLVRGPEEAGTFYALIHDPRGGVWTVGPNAGLCRIDGDRLRPVGPQEPLLRGTATGLAAYGEHVLVFGDDGLVAYDPSKDAFTGLDRALGTTGAKGQLNTFCTDGTGALWAATDRGMYKLRPRASLLDGQVTAAIIAWRWGDALLPLEDGHRLEHDQNFLGFHFIGAPCSAPDLLRFEYQLLGYDEQPILTREREVVYSRLPPGDHVFRVRAFLGQDPLPGSFATLNFTIALPWWRTAPAVASVSLVLLLALFLVVRGRERRARFRERIAQEQDRLRLEVLRSQMDPHFLFNSFNTLIELIEEDPPRAVEHVEDLSAFFRNVLQMRDKDVITVEEELRLLKPYFVLEQRRFEDRIALQVDLPEEFRKDRIPPLTLQMLVENALKHNAATKDRPLEVTIHADPSGITVSNPLRPRSTAMSSTSYGLESIRQRYKALTNVPVRIVRDQDIFRVQLPRLAGTDEDLDR